MNAIADGPVETSMSMYQDFQVYESGIYEHVYGSYLGDNLVEFVGYGEEDGQKFWKCKNIYGK